MPLNISEKKIDLNVVLNILRNKYAVPRFTTVNCAVSEEHDPDTTPNYWFAFHPHQKETLQSVPKSYVAFGCGSSKRILLIPFLDFNPWLEGMWTTQKR
jgi:hypothetical protein